MVDSDGNKVTLREYLEAKLAAEKEAMQVAREELNRRLAAMNHLQEAMKEMGSRMFTRPEHELYQSGVDARLKSLEVSRANTEGKASQVSVWIGYVFAVIGVILGAVALFHK